MLTKREVERRYDQARTDAKSGKYAEALEGYLFFLDNSDGGVRLSYTLSDIIALSEHYPAARKAIEDRRDGCEERILDGFGGYPEISDLTSFNRYLGAPERSIALLDRLANAGDTRQELYLELLEHLWKPLAEQGKHKKLEAVIEARAQSVARALTFSYIRWSFHAEGSHAYSRDLPMVHYYLDHASLAYETLIALNKNTAAEALARWVMKCDPDMTAEALLSAAALKANGAGAREQE